MKVYRYGLLRPSVGADLVYAEMRAAHDYRNRLVEIERRRRAELRSLYGERLQALQQAAEAAGHAAAAAAAAVKRARAESRSTKVDPALTAAAKATREAEREAVRALREARSKLREGGSIQPQVDAINARYADERRAARPTGGAVYWGTYQLAEDADKQSRVQPLYDGAEPNDPRFRRWTGEGQVSVQLIGGLDTQDVLGATDTQVQIAPGARLGRASPDSKRSRTKARKLLRLRVGSNADRSPVWAEWPMVMHRPLPAGRVKRATVSLRRHGPRAEWSVAITVNETQVALCRGHGALAVDLGWRQVRPTADERAGRRRGPDHALRVARWLDEEGREGEIRLAPEMLGGLLLPDQLRATRAAAFDAARDALFGRAAGLERPAIAGWIEQQPTVPEWLREAATTGRKWRAPARLAALCRRWQADRFAGDDDAYAALERWRYHDWHLWSWECGQRRSGRRRRKDLYRRIAARAAERYAVLVLEDFDLRRVAQRNPSPDAAAENETARHNRTLVAASELRGALVNAFRSRGGSVVEVAADLTTQWCAECDREERFEAALGIGHRCSHCGHLWDQDANAARNILRRWQRERSGDGGNGGSARGGGNGPSHGQDGESRWARARRLRAERDARLGGARDGGVQVAE